MHIRVSLVWCLPLGIFSIDPILRLPCIAWGTLVLGPTKRGIRLEESIDDRADHPVPHDDCESEQNDGAASILESSSKSKKPDGSPLIYLSCCLFGTAYIASPAPCPPDHRVDPRRLANRETMADARVLIGYEVLLFRSSGRR